MQTDHDQMLYDALLCLKDYNRCAIDKLMIIVLVMFTNTNIVCKHYQLTVDSKMFNNRTIALLIPHLTMV